MRFFWFVLKSNIDFSVFYTRLDCSHFLFPYPEYTNISGSFIFGLFLLFRLGIFDSGRFVLHLVSGFLLECSILDVNATLRDFIFSEISSVVGWVSG